MLEIEFSRQVDGAVVLRCRRPDGTETWQKQTKHAAHFVLHDLTHFAVETTLAYKRGFFGLIAEGWGIEDTTGKGIRGALPEQALEVERLVGLFDSERGSGVMWTAEELNEFAPRQLSVAEVQAIRNLRSSLFQQWFAVTPGATLRLDF